MALALREGSGDTKARAQRFRALLSDLVQKATRDMGTTPVGMMVGPFIPMVGPIISKMPDHTALAILGYVKERIHYVDTGENE